MNSPVLQQPLRLRQNYHPPRDVVPVWLKRIWRWL